MNGRDERGEEFRRGWWVLAGWKNGHDCDCDFCDYHEDKRVKEFFYVERPEDVTPLTAKAAAETFGYYPGDEETGTLDDIETETGAVVRPADGWECMARVGADPLTERMGFHLLNLQDGAGYTSRLTTLPDDQLPPPAFDPETPEYRFWRTYVRDGIDGLRRVYGRGT